MTDPNLVFVSGLALVVIGTACLGAWIGGPVLALGLPALVLGAMLMSGAALVQLNARRASEAGPDASDVA